MNGVFSFMLSVAAGVVANYIYKWLGRWFNKDCKHSIIRPLPGASTSEKGSYYLRFQMNSI